MSLYDKRPKIMRRIPPGAKIVHGPLKWRHRLTNSVPLSIRRWFFT